MTPPTNPGCQVDSKVKDKGWLYMFSEKVINSDLLIVNILVMCPESNLIKDKIPVLGLDIVERQSSLNFNHLCHTSLLR